MRAIVIMFVLTMVSNVTVSQCVYMDGDVSVDDDVYSNCKLVQNLNVTVYNGSLYSETASPTFRCRPTVENCSATQQTSTNGIYGIQNNLTYAVQVYLHLDEAAPFGVSFKCNNRSSLANPTILTTEPQSMLANVSPGSSGKIWCWFDLSNPLSGWMFSVNATGRYI